YGASREVTWLIGKRRVLQDRPSNRADHVQGNLVARSVSGQRATQAAATLSSFVISGYRVPSRITEEGLPSLRRAYKVEWVVDLDRIKYAPALSRTSRVGRHQVTCKGFAEIPLSLKRRRHGTYIKAGIAIPRPFVTNKEKGL